MRISDWSSDGCSSDLTGPRTGAQGLRTLRKGRRWSVLDAIRDRDVAELPGKRDEDWRWTDLRGLLRVLPDPSKPFAGDPGEGPFDALVEDRRVLVNGGEARIDVPAGSRTAVALRLVSRGAGSHAAQLIVTLGAHARLLLLESYESDAGSVSQAILTFELGRGAAVERVVLARDHEDRSEEHTSELQSLMRISYDVFSLKKKKSTPHT